MLLILSLYMFGLGLALHFLMQGTERLPRKERPRPSSMLLAAMAWPWVILVMMVHTLGKSFRGEL